MDVFAQIETSLNETQSKIQENVAWADKNLNSVADWIRNAMEIQNATKVKQLKNTNSASDPPSTPSTKTSWANVMDIMSFASSFTMFSR